MQVTSLAQLALDRDEDPFPFGDLDERCSETRHGIELTGKGGMSVIVSRRGIALAGVPDRSETLPHVVRLLKHGRSERYFER